MLIFYTQIFDEEGSEGLKARYIKKRRIIDLIIGSILKPRFFKVFLMC